MSPISYQILQTLAGGGFYSGQALGNQLGLTRAAVWKHIQQLQNFGVEINSIRGKGYRLPEPLELLDSSQIRAGLAEHVESSISRFDCFAQVGSTNSHLTEWALKNPGAKAAICLAESQSAGRGRRGKKWFSPFARNIYLSCAWRFDQGLSALSGLSLAVGVLIADLIEQRWSKKIHLKWPNDLLYENKKLGGVLIELSGDFSGDCFVVVGIGLNYAMPSAQIKNIDQPVCDLSSMGIQVSRNLLVIELINRLIDLFEKYTSQGFEHYKDSWLARAAFLNEAVKLSLGEKEIFGTFCSVDSQGSLVLDVGGEKRMFSGGEMSLRSIS